MQRFGATLQQQSQELARAQEQLAQLQEQLERQQAAAHGAAADLLAQGAQAAQQQRAAAQLRRALDQERVQLAEERGALMAERSAAGRAAGRAREAQLQLNEAVRALIQQGVPIRLSFEGGAGDVPVVTLLGGGGGAGAGAGVHRAAGGRSSGGVDTGALAQVLQRAGLAPEQQQQLGRERSEYLQQQQLLLARLKGGGGGVPAGAGATPGVHLQHAAAAAGRPLAAAGATAQAPPAAQPWPQALDEASELLAGASLTSLLPLSTSASEAALELGGGRQQGPGRCGGRQQGHAQAAAVGAVARLAAGASLPRASFDGGSLATVTETCLGGSSGGLTGSSEGG
jgi:hypothetical protein